MVLPLLRFEYLTTAQERVQPPCTSPPKPTFPQSTDDAPGPALRSLLRFLGYAWPKRILSVSKVVSFFFSTLLPFSGRRLLEEFVCDREASARRHLQLQPPTPASGVRFFSEIGPSFPSRSFSLPSCLRRKDMVNRDRSRVTPPLFFSPQM